MDCVKEKRMGKEGGGRRWAYPSEAPLSIFSRKASQRSPTTCSFRKEYSLAVGSFDCGGWSWGELGRMAE